MTSSEASRIRRNAVISACSLGFGQDAEDLAHDVILNHIEGKGKKQLVDFAVIDMIRKRSGNPRVHSRAQRVALNETVEYDEDKLPDTREPKPMTFEHTLEDLSRDQRICVFLYFVWGLDMKEIGECIGVTESRIVQILRDTFKLLRGDICNGITNIT
jgi:hypothetical protein